LGDELDADPNAPDAADHREHRQLEQAHGEERENDPQDDCADGAPEHAPAPLPIGQVAARERDHHRVVARQQDVDDDDFETREPELRRAEFHSGGTPMRAASRSARQLKRQGYSTDCNSFPISAGLRVTVMPDASMISSFSCAVPLPPEMIAPACPIRLPGGAVTPAMKRTTGLRMCCFAQAAAISSSDPPISPIITTASVSLSSFDRSSTL